jgi:hypothetical protein
MRVMNEESGIPTYDFTLFGVQTLKVTEFRPGFVWISTQRRMSNEGRVLFDQVKHEPEGVKKTCGGINLRWANWVLAVLCSET